jgi:hypothetical protein
MAKIFIYRSGGITTAGIEGYAQDLEPCINKYQKNKPKFYVDFSPLFREADNRLFIVGNVYFPEVSTAVFYQDVGGVNPRTSISCHGTSEEAIDIIKDFGRVLDFKTIEPTEKFKNELRSSHSPLEELWKMSENLGRNSQKALFAIALGNQQQLYRNKKANMN